MTETVYTPPSPTLHKKVACIIGEVQTLKPKPSGKNQFGVEAFSIGDVESVVGPLLAQYGVTIEPSMNYLEPQDKLWRVGMDYIVRDADNPEDFFSGQWIDIGGNPAAAVSFATKAYLKRLFHIADYEEDNHPHTEPQPQLRGSGQRTGANQRGNAALTPPRPGAATSSR
jgi:hypothetical protein